MKVGNTFHDHLVEKQKGKKYKENAIAKTNVKTVKEKKRCLSLLICWKQILLYGMYITLITPSMT